jgi:hypothetical protein
MDIVLGTDNHCCTTTVQMPTAQHNCQTATALHCPTHNMHLYEKSTTGDLCKLATTNLQNIRQAWPVESSRMRMSCMVGGWLPHCILSSRAEQVGARTPPEFRIFVSSVGALNVHCLLHFLHHTQRIPLPRQPLSLFTYPPTNSRRVTQPGWARCT